MSEILKVLNRKVELKSEVVEFGVAQDIKKLLSEAKKIAVKGDKQQAKNNEANKRYTKEWENSRPIIKDASAITKNLLAIEKRAITAAKELGVDVKAIDGFSELQSAYDSVQGLEKWLDFKLP